MRGPDAAFKKCCRNSGRFRRRQTRGLLQGALRGGLGGPPNAPGREAAPLASVAQPEEHRASTPGAEVPLLSGALIVLRSTASYERTISQRSATSFARSACSRQQPACGKMNNEPHSSPGRFQLEPSCAFTSAGATVAPLDAMAESRRSPWPPIRQTIFVALAMTPSSTAACGSENSPPSRSAHSVPEPRASRVIAFAAYGGEHPGAPSGTNVDSGYGPTSTRRDTFLKASLQVPGNANVYAPRQSVLLTRRSRSRADVRRGVVKRTTMGAVNLPAP
jgi:hypothetical protein